MGKTWSEIVKEAYSKGILLDGCGTDERYYYSGKFDDFCGFDISTEKCECGYSKDWGSGGGGSGSGDTGSTSSVTYTAYAGLLDYKTYDTRDKVTATEVAAMTKYSEKKTLLESGVEYGYTLEPNGYDAATVITGTTEEEQMAEMAELKKQYAKTFVFAIESSAGDLTIKSEGDDTDNWKPTSTVTIDGKEYTVYIRIESDTQVDVYDTATETPETYTFKYIISIV